MALQEHLGNACADTEVAVDLEGRVGIVEVIVHASGILVGAVRGAVLQGILQDDVGMVAIVSASPEVDLPTHAPSRGGVAAQFQAVDGRHEIGTGGTYLTKRIERHEVTHVAMAGVLRHVVGRVFPFAQQQVAFLNSVARVRPAGVERGGGVGFGVQSLVGLLEIEVEFLDIGLAKSRDGRTEDVIGLLHALEQGVDELLGMGCAVLLRMVVLFGRIFIRSHQRAVGVEGVGRALVAAVLCGAVVASVLDETFHPELCTTPHGREGASQKLVVERVAVVLPQVAAVPGVGHEVVVAPRAHAAPDVALREDGPSLRDLAILASSILVTAHLCHLDDEVEEGQVHLRQVGGFGRPVVHLHVDVGVYVAVPGCRSQVVPDALQVAGDVHASRTADFEVAPVGKVELFEESCLAVVEVRERVVVVDELVGRTLRGCSLKREGHASHERLEVLNVVGQQVVESLCCGSVEDGKQAFLYVACAFLGEAFAVRLAVVVAGDGREEHHHLVGIGDRDGPLGSVVGGCSLRGQQDAGVGLISQPVVEFPVESQVARCGSCLTHDAVTRVDVASGREAEA